MPLKPFVIHILPIGVIILSLILISQILTSLSTIVVAADEQNDQIKNLHKQML
jgi:hypothetical protein